MTRLIKTLLALFVSPVLRLLRPVTELLQRLHGFVMLNARISGVDASVVVLGPPEVFGTGRIQLGKNLRLYSGLYFETQDAGTIEIGDDVVINRGTHVVAFSSVTIGAGTMIGEYVSIRDGNHRRAADGALRETGHDSAPIAIGRNVWIGRGVMILPGVSIGDGATVGANAVVTRDVPAGVLVAGVPARMIQKKDQETAAKVR